MMYIYYFPDLKMLERIYLSSFLSVEAWKWVCYMHIGIWGNSCKVFLLIEMVQISTQLWLMSSEFGICIVVFLNPFTPWLSSSDEALIDLGFLAGFYGSDHCPVSLELSPAISDSNEGWPFFFWHDAFIWFPSLLNRTSCKVVFVVAVMLTRPRVYCLITDLWFHRALWLRCFRTWMPKVGPPLAYAPGNSSAQRKYIIINLLALGAVYHRYGVQLIRFWIKPGKIMKIQNVYYKQSNWTI